MARAGKHRGGPDAGSTDAQPTAARRRDRGRARPPAPTAGQAERDQYAATTATLRREALAQAKPIEYRLYYGDFREINGVKWPFRLRRAIAGETMEEMTFDRFRINTKIDPRKFEALK
jgi:hypothetical protein